MRKEKNHMKPDYKNWVPKGMMWTLMLVSAIILACFLLFGVCGKVEGAGI